MYDMFGNPTGLEVADFVPVPMRICTSNGSESSSSGDHEGGTSGDNFEVDNFEVDSNFVNKWTLSGCNEGGEIEWPSDVPNELSSDLNHAFFDAGGHSREENAKENERSEDATMERYGDELLLIRDDDRANNIVGSNDPEDLDNDFDESNGIGDIYGVDQEGGHRSTSLSNLPVLRNSASEQGTGPHSVMVEDSRPPSGQVAELNLNVLEHNLSFGSNADGPEF